MRKPVTPSNERNYLSITQFKRNIHQVRKQARRAMRLSATCRAILEGYNKQSPEARAEGDRRTEVRHEHRKAVATEFLKRAHSILGGLMHYCAYHNVQDSPESEAPVPFRNATPHRLRRNELAMVA